MDEQKYFSDSQTGRLNSDDSEFALGENEWCNMENCRTGSTDAGKTAVVESIGSTLLLSTPQPSVVFLEIGAAEEEETGRFCYFKYNTIGVAHKIVCYDSIAKVEYDVLLSSQVTGGLNFSKDFPVHSANIINGMLYWVEERYNQPRKINIDSAIKANNPAFVTSAVPYNFPINFSEITTIKPPPIFPPYIIKGTDVAFNNNFIANDSFEFAMQYSYFDNEVTVTSPYSTASRLNRVDETDNYILVAMPFTEVIPDTIRIVNLIARTGDGTSGGGNIGNVIKTWDKLVASEAVEIAAQNSGTNQLQFRFYNNLTGAAIAKDDVLRPFDNVPIFSGTQSAAKNRLFLADNTEGYDTPATTSMQMELGTEIILTDSQQTTSLVAFKHRNTTFHINLPPFFGQYAYSGWYVYLTFLTPVGWYLINGTDTTQLGSINYPPLPAAPTSVSITGLTFEGATESEVAFNTRPAGYNTNYIWADYSGGQSVIVTGLTSTTFNAFLQKSPYRGGMVFYDFALRRCGVVTNDGLIVTTPVRDFAYSTAVSQINWTVSNVNALNEIPDWAYYYAPLRTLNLRTRGFIDSFTDAARYATKDASNAYVFTSTLFSTINVVGIGLNTSALNHSGLGYVFTQGDICILIKNDNSVYQLPVLGQDGNYIIIKSQDIGDLGSSRFVFEIFTPYQTSIGEPYYEIGQMYLVTDPTTVNRQYSTIAGVFNSDSYILSRNFNATTYFACAMSPNDLFFKRWDNDGGKANFITKLGQVRKRHYISWSDVFIPNTSVNGLSTFRLGNEKPVPEECGTIEKLQLTSKVQAEGTVMLSICGGGETNSMYLEETQITDATGQVQFLGASTNVISTINTLKGSRGTTHPESVCEYRGNVYWWDDLNGKITQYSANGLFDISDYKMVRFWKLFTLQFNSMTAAQIEALGGRPFVFSVVDPAHDELLFSIPKLLAVPPKGYLPDYKPYTIADINVIGTPPTLRVPTVGGVLVTQPFSFTYSAVLNGNTILGTGHFNIGEYLGINDATGTIHFDFDTMIITSIYGDRSDMYPFDIWDGQGKTICYELNFGNGTPKWKGSYAFNPEGFISLKNNLYSFRNGLNYQHNQLTSQNNFYGTQYKSRVMFVSNMLPQLPKVYDNFSSQSNIVPSFVYFYSAYPYVQTSDLVDFDFRQFEGIWKATIYRNKIQPTQDGYTATSLLTGEKMRNTNMLILVEFTVGATPLEFRFVTVGFSVSHGQMQQLKK